MEESIFYNISGVHIVPNELSISRAIATYHAIEQHQDFVLLTVMQECSEDIKQESLIVDVSPGIVQHPINDIKYQERLALCFNEKDNSYPEVKALRKTFPDLIHENLTVEGFPKALCLYEQPFADGKHSWTPRKFLNQICYWLRENAKGILHQETQSLEPLYFSSPWGAIAIPSNFDSKSDEKGCWNIVIRWNNFGIIEWNMDSKTIKKQKNIVIPVILKIPPVVHEKIHSLPIKFSDLFDLCPKDCSLIEILRNEIKRLIKADIFPSNAQVILLLPIGLRRNSKSLMEKINWYGFLCKCNFQELAKNIDIVELNDGSMGLVLLPKKFVDFSIFMLDVHFIPGKELLASYNGISATPEPHAGLIIGAGSLGAEILENFFKMGWGQWTIIDNDKILPHNLARHHLDYNFIGSYKATGMSIALTGGEKMGAVNYILEDFCEYNDIEKYDLIIDISTSVSVQRQLAIRTLGNARRICCFLFPSGNGSVIFVEDIKRKNKLDTLEAQYYRLIIKEKLLAGDFNNIPLAKRYGFGCRDISLSLPFDSIVLHAGLISKIIRSKYKLTESHLEVNYCDNENQIHKYVEPVQNIQEYKLNDGLGNEWIIVLDEYVLDKMRSMRAKELPRETGSAIFGYHDTFYKKIYIVDVSETPEDSVKETTFFIRGKESLFEYRQYVNNATSGIVDYIGEWHSHPGDCSVLPSCWDKVLLNELSRHLSIEGLPAVMIIVGNKNKTGYYLKHYEQ